MQINVEIPILQKRCVDVMESAPTMRLPLITAATRISGEMSASSQIRDP